VNVHDVYMLRSAAKSSKMFDICLESSDAVDCLLAVCKTSALFSMNSCSDCTMILRP